MGKGRIDYGYSEWDNKIPDKIYFNEIFRISKNQIIFGGNYFTEYLKNSSCWLVWDKNNGKTDFADCELLYTSFKSAIRKYTYTWQGMLQENMKHKQKRVHPTEKPILLLIKIINDYTKHNDIILDPFAGSGTTAVACIKTGRRYICIEKEKKYVNIIHKRIQEAEESVSLLNMVVEAE
jgi:site-specific DNA-methyltransferase (adenine-specific)